MPKSNRLTIEELDELRRRSQAYDRLILWMERQQKGPKDYELCVSDIRGVLEGN